MLQTCMRKIACQKQKTKNALGVVIFAEMPECCPNPVARHLKEPLYLGPAVLQCSETGACEDRSDGGTSAKRLVDRVKVSG